MNPLLTRTRTTKDLSDVTMLGGLVPVQGIGGLGLLGILF